MLLQCRPGAGRPPPLHPIVRHTPLVLHVTNGDGAARRLRAAGASGDVLPWRDALHEGPVTPDLDAAQLRAERASFIGVARVGGSLERARSDGPARRAASPRRWPPARRSSCGSTMPDLYDVLQLAQILDRVVPGRARLVLVGVDEFAGVAELPDRELLRLMHGEDTVREDEVAAARALWDAFRAPEPHALHALPQGTVSSGPRPAATCSSSPGPATG